MTRMTQTVEASGAAPSRLVAREIRAELGRQQISQRRLALMTGTNYNWVNRRLAIDAPVDMTFEDVDRMAKALHVPVQRLVSAWLPRLDSNQKPAGYPTRATLSVPLAA